MLLFATLRYIFWEGHKLWKNLQLGLTFFKLLWPFQKTWIHNHFVTYYKFLIELHELIDGICPSFNYVTWYSWTRDKFHWSIEFLERKKWNMYFLLIFKHLFQIQLKISESTWSDYLIYLLEWALWFWVYKDII